MRYLSFALSFALTLPPIVSARAAPPEDSEDSEDSEASEASEDSEASEGSEASEDSEVETCDLANLHAGRDLYKRGYKYFNDGDFISAIELWELVPVLMPSKEASLRVDLAHAYRKAYAIDGDTDHLRAAHSLFQKQLASLDPDDEAREVLEAEVANIEAIFEAEDKARAEAQAAREEEIRQEQIRLNELTLARTQAEAQAKIQKVYLGAGGSMAGVGLGSLAATTAFLVLGAKVDRQGRELAESTDNTPDDYEELILRGQSYNRAAITTGVVGGVLVLSGASLLIVALVRHKRAGVPAGARATLDPSLGGLSLRF